MKKKAYVLGVLSIVTVVSSLVAFIAESSSMLSNAQNTVNEIWGHYTAVAATSTTPGCKEF